MDENDKFQDKKKVDIAGKLPERIYKIRSSLLTDLYEVSHFRAIFNIFVILVLVIFCNNLVTDSLECERLYLKEFVLIERAFQNLPKCLIIVLLMNLCPLLLLYPSFYFWATFRQNLNKSLRKFFDLIAAFGFIVYYIGFMYYPAYFHLKFSFPTATSAVLTCEQIRILMKMYAFVRHNIPRALNYKNSPVISEFQNETKLGKTSQEKIRLRKPSANKKSDGINENNFEENEKLLCPNFWKFLYYFYAPTLIYRDHYPRNTGKIRWSFIFSNIAQIFGSVYLLSFFTTRFFHGYFKNFADSSKPENLMTVRELAHAFFVFFFLGFFSTVMAFYILLHCWSNVSAELLGFGDRLYYKDWWNSSNFSEYYKNWNLLIHDWLYTYVYKDAWECGLGKINRAIPSILVFTLSSLVHEYLIIMGFGFFYPVLLINFGIFGLILSFIKTKQSAASNALFLFGYMFGNGIMFTLYSMEFMARINCPPKENNFWVFITPQSWKCKSIQW